MIKKTQPVLFFYGCFILIPALIGFSIALLTNDYSRRFFTQLIYFSNLISFFILLGYLILIPSGILHCIYYRFSKRRFSQHVPVFFGYRLMFIVLFLLCLFLFGNGISYSDYTDRTHVAEGLSLANAAKMQIDEFHKQEHRWPVNNQEAGLTSPDKITGRAVKSIRIIKDGRVVITYNKKVKDRDNVEVLLVPKTITNEEGKTEVRWNCGTWAADHPQSIRLGYLPSNCRQYCVNNICK